MSIPPEEQAKVDLVRRNLGDLATCLLPDDADIVVLLGDAGGDVCRATLLELLRVMNSRSLFQQYASQFDPQEALALREAVESSYETWLAWCSASGTTGLPQAPGQSGSANTGAATLDLPTPETATPSWYPWVGNKNLPLDPTYDDAPTTSEVTAMKSRRLR